MLVIFPFEVDFYKQFNYQVHYVGNPVMDESKLDVLKGIPLFHSKDKKEVCYIGRDKTANFDKITLIYTGSFRPVRKITGIFNRINK